MNCQPSKLINIRPNSPQSIRQAIDNKKRHAAIVGIVPLNPASHDSMVRDLQSVLAAGKMLGGQGATRLFDQPPKRRQQVVLRVTNDLEVVASRTAVVEFKGVESDFGSKQMGSKVKLVEVSRAISQTYRFELGVFESFRPIHFGHFRVEALATESPVPTFHGAVGGAPIRLGPRSVRIADGKTFALEDHTQEVTGDSAPNRGSGGKVTPAGERIRFAESPPRIEVESGAGIRFATMQVKSRRIAQR